MSKKIVAVGFAFPNDDVEHIPVTSKASLLDADIILFNPQLPYDTGHTQDFQGKPCYSDSGSALVKDVFNHWSVQLREALTHGKTIVVFLDTVRSIFIATGEKQVSGTGKNARTTRIVDEVNNYRMISFKLGNIINAEGKSITLVGKNNPLAGLFHATKDYFQYHVYLENSEFDTLISTKAGQKSVGGRLQKNGTAILLPYIDFDQEDFEDENEEGETIWSDAALTLGKRLTSLLVELDASSKAESTATIAPNWVQGTTYRFTIEDERDVQVKALESKLDEIQREIDLHHLKADEQTSLRALLYENGKPLENAVRQALSILGFDVSHIDNGENEFDAVFVSNEGRFIGEFEGKDNKAISIEKLSQLERNIQEDFARDGVNEYAKGVLFGNAYRLIEPEKREEFFTAKVYTGAKRAGIALIRTPDLFVVARHILHNPDPSFSRACREAIAAAVGEVVTFPSLPNQSETKGPAEGEN